MDIALTWLVVAMPIMIAVWATVKVVRDEFSERRQKTAQLVLVWLVPILGPLCVLAVHRSTEKPSGNYRRDAMEPDFIDGLGVGRSIKTFADVIGDD